ncbi:hypothetical protein B0H63DRAFT_506802 [Podospora didyma]|uniref:Uncharacterized protein n=1 Tax=Podospora didyma TaxID=330526 RepID=A0AAE0U8X5_9PEZI|nr:hypothetical protein B0H63DRAFT_506802 [Podospora didyma]
MTTTTSFSPIPTTGTIIIILFLIILHANPVNADRLTDWLNNPGYDQGGTAREQIHCYALPFGAIGFASHLLTYVTVLCLASGRSPWWPKRKLTGRKVNLAFGIIGLSITIPLTVLTMMHCRNSWSFILISVWKLVLSVTLSFMTINAARRILDEPQRILGRNSTNFYDYATYRGASLSPGRHQGQGSTKESRSRSTDRGYAHPQRDASAEGRGRDNPAGRGRHSAANDSTYHGDVSPSPRPREDHRTRSGGFTTSVSEAGHHKKDAFRDVMWWSLLYVPGCIIGFVGVMNLLYHNFADVEGLRTVTYVFIGIPAGLVVLSLVLMRYLMKRDVADEGWVFITGFGAALTGLTVVLVFTVLFAFYADFVLAALADDWVGVPSSENAVFYWTYFAAKRLPMVSI